MTTETKAALDALLPCPFCGGEADLQSRRGQYAGYYVSCHTEDCNGNPSDDGFSFVKKEYAIEAWNTRTPHPESNAVEVVTVGDDEVREAVIGICRIFDEHGVPFGAARKHLTTLERAATAPKNVEGLVDKIKYTYTMPNTCFGKDGYVCALVFDTAEQAILAAEVMRHAPEREQKT